MAGYLLQYHQFPNRADEPEWPAEPSVSPLPAGLSPEQACRDLTRRRRRYHVAKLPGQIGIEFDSYLDGGSTPDSDPVWRRLRTRCVYVDSSCHDALAWQAEQGHATDLCGAAPGRVCEPWCPSHAADPEYC